jgi:hypothetical protein
MRKLIMCPECAKEVAEEGTPLYLAMYGPQGAGIDDPAILVSIPVSKVNHEGISPLLIELTGGRVAATVTCDGNCDQELAVSESSLWFLEQKLALDNLPIQ